MSNIRRQESVGVLQVIKGKRQIKRANKGILIPAKNDQTIARQISTAVRERAIWLKGLLEQGTRKPQSTNLIIEGGEICKNQNSHPPLVSTKSLSTLTRLSTTQTKTAFIESPSIYNAFTQSRFNSGKSHQTSLKASRFGFTKNLPSIKTNLSSKS